MPARVQYAQREHLGSRRGRARVRDGREREAQLDRAERLAEENEELREEVAHLRVESAGAEADPAPAAKEAAPPDSLTRKTLDRLEQLGEEIDQHAAAIPTAPFVPDALPAWEPRTRVAITDGAEPIPGTNPTRSATLDSDGVLEIWRLRDENKRLNAHLSRVHVALMIGVTTIVLLIVFMLGYLLRR